MLRSDMIGVEEGQKGDWCFLNENTQLFLRYGEDAFKEVVMLPISLEGDAKHWKWNGNVEAPSLTPSILVSESSGWSVGWHGYLTDGKLITV